MKRVCFLLVKPRLSFYFAENINFNGTGKHLPPCLQKGLQPGIAGDLLAACLERRVNLVIDELSKLRRVVDILQKANLLAAEQLIVGRSRLDERCELGGVRGRQRKLELQDPRNVFFAVFFAVLGHFPFFTRPRALRGHDRPTLARSGDVLMSVASTNLGTNATRKRRRVPG